MEKNMETKTKTTSSDEARKLESPLKNKKVYVHPIKRPGGLVQDPEHEASFLFGPATFKFTVPMTRTGKLVDPLTPEEREWFENYDRTLNFKPGSTSIYGDEHGNNMWHNYKVEIGKEVRVLDLSDPQDYLDYKVLLANSDKIAPSWAERNEKVTYKYALVDEDTRARSEASKADKMKRAYSHYGKIEDSPDEIKKFLRIYGNKPSENARHDFLRSELSRIIEEDIDGYLAVAEDINYDMKDFINSAIEVGAIVKKKNEYKLPGGDVIGRSLDDLIEYLNDKKNQDIYEHIHAQIEAAK